MDFSGFFAFEEGVVGWWVGGGGSMQEGAQTDTRSRGERGQRKRGS